MKKLLPQIILIAIITTIYLVTLAPSLTWANNGADGGDLITAAKVWGVAHPSGYPLYLLLAELFQQIPVGDLAFRTNLLSMVCGIGTVWVTYQICLQFAPQSSKAAFFSAVAIGLSPAVWSQAIIAEVYTLHLLLLALVILQAFMTKPDDHTNLLRGVTFGLAISNHLTSILFLPILFLENGRISQNPKKIAKRLFFALLIAFLFYSTLVLRAWYDPPINWGIAKSLNNLFELISGKMYYVYILPTNADGFFRVILLVQEFIRQFGGIGWTIILVGFVLTPGLHVFRGTTIFLLILTVVFVLLYNTEDARLYFIPVYLLMAVWSGLGLEHVLKWWTRITKLPVALFFIPAVIFIIGWNTFDNWKSVDAAHDDSANLFAREILAKMPEDAIIFTTDDKSTFSLWYYQFGLGERKDVAIISLSMFQQSWYPLMLHDAYPDLILPEDVKNIRSNIANINPSRPACDVFALPEPAYMCP